MSMNSSEVSIAITGAFSKVDESTIITSASSDISGVGTINYGYISADGITISTETTTTNIVAWQNSNTVRVATGEGKSDYKLVLTQLSKEVRELYAGSKEVNGKILFNPNQMTRGIFVIDYIDSAYSGVGEILYGRHVLRNAMVTSRDDIVLANGTEIGHGLTITAFPDENGVVADIYHSTGAVEV